MKPLLTRLTLISLMSGLILGTSVGASIPVSAAAAPVCADLALVNGGFEIPNSGISIGTTIADASSNPLKIGWHTTQTPKVIEYWPGKNPGVPAQEGSNFVELNASQPGALYQDIATQPGTSIAWSLAHRGRQGVDVMSVRIGNAVGATDVFASHGGGGLVQQGGGLADGTTAWGIHSGVYRVPTEQTLTRFWFEAVTSEGGDSYGNFLDAISFAPVGCSVPTPTFNPPSLNPTSDGFTVQLTNYDPVNYTWAATTSSGVVSISISGLVTVSGAPNTASTVTVTASQLGYINGTASITSSSLGSALIPNFGTPIGTGDGFRVSITNYDSSFSWTSPVVSSGVVSIESTDGSTRTFLVTGLTSGSNATIALATAKSGYVSGSALVTGTAGSLYPNMTRAVPTSDGFTSQITNYSSDYAWSATVTAGGAVAIDGSGVVTVTGLGLGVSSVATITASKTGFLDGTGTVSGTSLTTYARALTIDTSTVLTSYTSSTLPTSFTASPSLGSGSGVITFATSTPSKCGINSSSGAVSFLASGTCSVSASITAVGDYAAASSAAISFSVSGAEFLVHYLGNGGAAALSGDSYTYLGSPLVLPTAVRAGYNLIGWYDTATAGTLVGLASETLTVISERNLYAQWSPKTYTITYAPNWGTAPSTTDTYTVGNVGRTLPAVERENFQFNGWYSALSGGVLIGKTSETFMPSDTTTVHAQWTQNSLVGLTSPTLIGSITTLSGVGNTYSATASDTAITINYEADALPANTVINTYLQGDLTHAKSFITTAQNVLLSLVVSWLSESATVPNTAPGRPITVNITNPGIKIGAQIYILIANSLTLVGTASKDGQVTVALTSDPEIIINNPVSVAPIISSPVNNSASAAPVNSSSITTYWKVTFDSNSSNSGSVPAALSVVAGSGSSIILPTDAGTLLRTGYVFMGWATSTSSKVLLNSSYLPYGNITIYAVWEEVVIPTPIATPTPAPAPTPTPTKSSEALAVENVQPAAMKKVGSIYFASGAYFLNDESKKTIKALASSIFLKSPEVVLSFGHTDVKGGTNNTLLSQNRAKAVAKLLRSLLPGQKIFTGWYASSKPVATGTSKSALAKNRRVEIYVK